MDVQSEGVKIWLEIQETTKGAIGLEDSGPIDSRKRKTERDKENPL